MGKITRRQFIGGVAAGGVATALGGPAHAALGRDALARTAGLGLPSNAPIDSIVVVMMENRSFDHFLGWMRGADSQQAGLLYADDEGQLHPTRPWAPDYKGCGYVDPDHGWNGGRTQLDPVARDASGFRKGRNDDYALGYYSPEDIPVWAALTREATIFKHYHCAVLGPTYPNREYQHAATSGGRKTNAFPDNPIAGFQDTTIWDRCNERGVTWAYYYSNLPVIGLYGARLAGPNVRHISSYYADAAAGRLPQVCFVDPFFVTPEGLANDDHPHADIRLGQQFLADVIGAFTSSPQWRRGALFVNYDEWGGFFDTVVPPRAADDDRANALDLDNDFAQLGFRTPATVVSPYAPRGRVAAHVYDHTSILKFIEWRYGLAPLTRRDAAARNIGEVLDFKKPDFSPPEIPAYVAPPDARIPCEVEETFEGSDLYHIATSGLAESLGLRVDYAFADSYRSF